MCFSKLIRKGALHLEPKVATRPIKVIKIGSKFYRIGSICEKISDKNRFASYAFPRLYNKDELCTQKLEPELFYNGHIVKIHKGFHSYRFLPYRITSRTKWNTYIGRNGTIGIFEIPAGAIYYSDNVYFVSDSIILRKVINSYKEWRGIDFKPEFIL